MIQRLSQQEVKSKNVSDGIHNIPNYASHLYYTCYRHLFSVILREKEVILRKDEWGDIAFKPIHHYFLNAGQFFLKRLLV